MLKIFKQWSLRRKQLKVQATAIFFKAIMDNEHTPLADRDLQDPIMWSLNYPKRSAIQRGIGLTQILNHDAKADQNTNRAEYNKLAKKAIKDIYDSLRTNREA